MSTEKPDFLSDDLGNSSLQRQKFGWPQKKFTKIQITSEKVHKSSDDLRNSSPRSLYDLGISVFGILFLVRKFCVVRTPINGCFLALYCQLATTYNIVWCFTMRFKGKFRGPNKVQRLDCVPGCSWASGGIQRFREIRRLPKKLDERK